MRRCMDCGGLVYTVETADNEFHTLHWHNDSEKCDEKVTNAFDRTDATPGEGGSSTKPG